MHISTPNILQMVIGKKLPLPTNIKSHPTLALAYLYLILAYSTGQGQGHAHFDCQYLADGDRMAKYCYWQQIERRIRAFV